MDTQSSIWVFGYGSLMWNPDFLYNSQEIGHIKGYQRRFWQGNVTHRGTKNKPGRVGTLVESKKDCVWGVAYEVIGRDYILKALGYLNRREKELGGYTTLIEDFYSRNGEQRKVLVYTATSDNELYLGPGDMDTMAIEIVAAHGNSGPNAEYVIRIADYIRQNIPEDNDTHLFTLVKHICDLVQQSKTVENIPEPILTYDRLVDPVRT